MQGSVYFIVALLFLLHNIQSLNAQEPGYPSVHGKPSHKPHVFIVAVVTSPAAWRERRGWVREQWDKNMQILRKHTASHHKPFPEIIFKFLVGAKDEADESIKGVLKEEKEFEDILWLDDVDDVETDYMFMHPNWPWFNTSSTSEKVIYSMQWAVDNYDFDYFARIGDDAYFRPDEFYRQASAGSFPLNLALMGHFTGPLAYNILDKLNVIAYPMGGGYVVTHDVAVFVSKSAGMLNPGFPEDANLGAWLTGTRVQFMHIPDSIHDIDQASYHYRPCSPKDVLVHHMRTQEDWKRIDDSGELVC